MSGSKSIRIGKFQEALADVVTFVEHHSECLEAVICAKAMFEEQKCDIVLSGAAF